MRFFSLALILVIVSTSIAKYPLVDLDQTKREPCNSFECRPTKCNGFRCTDERGGICSREGAPCILREGMVSWGVQGSCCDGMICHNETKICLAKGGKQQK